MQAQPRAFPVAPVASTPLGLTVGVEKAPLEASDYLPAPRMKPQRRYADRAKVNQPAPVTIDPACAAVMIPFASFVDRGMVRRAREARVISTVIGQQIDGVKRKFELQKDAIGGLLSRPSF